ncbi:Protease 3 [Balamuthia mandrillaris]
MNGQEGAARGIIRSEEDKRSYKSVVLTNELQVLLVSDPETDKAAAAMNVNVGSFSDPDGVAGLAHFLEHMLFLGTEKYPDEQSYSSYLAEHGGSSNAYTDLENTNYYFDVTPDYFQGALDRFAQFFIAPLFTEDAADREMHAVDSENTKNLQADVFRLFQLMKSTASPNHPFHKFATGNLYTLRDATKEASIDLRAELLAFHKKYYSANHMKLVLLSKEPIDILEKWAVEMFSPIVNTNREQQVFNGIPFEEEHLQILQKVVPVKPIRSISLTFPMPTQLPFFRQKPCSYLSHLIGHEGPGSILALLKAKGWSNGLIAGPDRTTADFTLFKISIDVTPKGLEEWEQVVDVIFQYIKLLRTEGPKQHIFEESKKLAEIEFRFADKHHPIEYVCFLANCMQQYPTEWILAGPMLFDEYNPQLIQETLTTYLTPKNMRLRLVAKDFQEEDKQKMKEEKWYGTQYIEERLTSAFLDRLSDPPQLDPELFLPRPNEFIPEDLSLRPLPSENDTSSTPSPPELIECTDRTKVWHKQEVQRFKLPKADILIEFATPWAYATPRHHVLTSLFTKLLMDALAEFSYDAELAGLLYKLDAAIVGMQLVISGFNDKQALLLRRILEKMVKFEVKDEHRFLALKDLLARTYGAFRSEQPYVHSMYNMNVCMEHLRWHSDSFLEAIQDVTSKELEAFVPQLLSGLFVECLFHGNLTKQEALDLSKEIREVLKLKPLHPSLLPERRVIMLSHDTSYLLRCNGTNPDESGTALTNYYQIGLEADSIRKTVLSELFCQIISDSFFHELRTKQQLGYIVHSSVQRENGAFGLRIIVQSEKDPNFLDERVEEFLSNTTSALLEKLSSSHENEEENKEWQNHKAALAARKLEKAKTLFQQSGRYWAEITNHSYFFDKDVKEVEELQKITLKELKEFYETYIIGPQRRKFSSQILSPPPQQQTSKSEESSSSPVVEEVKLSSSKTVLIDDIPIFKKRMPLYPALSSFSH